MTTTTQITLEEVQKATLDEGKVVVMPASWEEFVEFLPTTHYKVEFINNQIVIMGLAKLIHEWLVMHIGFILKTLYANQENVLVLGSNLGVSRPEKSFFNPDITIIKGKPDFYKDSKSIITNPCLVVEILSERTVSYDWETKLPRYQKIETIQEIILIDLHEKVITTINRTADSKVWTMSIYDQDTDTVVIDGHTFPHPYFFQGMPVFE
ncbi:MAG: Uma2 family endonuclease [Spirosomataceae bacterium]